MVGSSTSGVTGRFARAILVRNGSRLRLIRMIFKVVSESASIRAIMGSDVIRDYDMTNHAFYTIRCLTNH
jgi:hypothetical protein